MDEADHQPDRGGSLAEQLLEARREAARWQRKYRELQRIVEKQHLASSELCRAQTERVQSAKHILALAYRDHAELGLELGALDSDLVSVVRTLVGSLAGVLDRALDGSDESGLEVRMQRAERADGAERAEPQRADHATDNASARPSPSPSKPHAPPTDCEFDSDDFGGGRAGEENSPPRSEQPIPPPRREQPVSSNSSATARGSAREGGSGGERSDELSVSVSSVFIASGGTPSSLPHLLLALDLLGIEGLAVELERTEDAGVYTTSLAKQLALPAGSRARAKLVRALADDNQAASDVRLTLLGSDFESEPVELASATVNLESLLEARRNLRHEPCALLAPGGEEIGSVSVSVLALRALSSIDRLLSEHGSAARVLEAELAASRGAAVFASPSHEGLPLTPLSEEGEDGLEAGSAGGGAAGTSPARRRAVSMVSESVQASQPQELLSPQLQRLRDRVAGTESTYFSNVRLATDLPREGHARVEAQPSPTEASAWLPRIRRKSRLSTSVGNLVALVTGSPRRPTTVSSPANSSRGGSRLPSPSARGAAQLPSGRGRSASDPHGLGSPRYS